MRSLRSPEPIRFLRWSARAWCKPFLLPFEDPAAQDAHGPVVVLVLAALVLALDFHLVGGAFLVPDADGAFGLVDVLAARPAGAHPFPFDVAASLISTCTSSGSGMTATVAAEVWMRPCVSVLGTRWTRWPPLSYLRCWKASSPVMLKMISL